MLSLLKEIILDFQEVKLDVGKPRNFKIISLPKKASICIGVRRCGKSTVLFQKIQALIDQGISRKQILYINFFDDRLHNLQHEGLGKIIEAFFSIYPEKKQQEKIYCFFDEIQVIPGWEAFIDRLLRSENCEIYITGSSAHMLSKEIATQMRGRALSWELFPLSFREFLTFREIPSEEPFSSKKRLTIQKAFEDYQSYGGFPELVMGLEPSLQVKIHQEYFNAILFRDLVERHDISHPKAVADLAHWLVNNIGSLYSVNRLTAYLKSLGHKISKDSISSYLLWFEDTYLLFTLPIFDASVSRTNANPKKIYCIDHALAQSVGTGILVNSGHKLENILFIALRRVFSSVFYFKSRKGKEIDFIVQKANRSYLLIQVCESMENERTREREISALSEGMQELKLKEGIIVTQCEEEEIQVESGSIQVIPAWQFLLSLS